MLALCVWEMVTGLSPVCHGEVSVADFLFCMLLVYVFTCSAKQSLTNSYSHVLVSLNFFLLFLLRLD